MWFFLSFKLYNSQFNTSTNIEKAGQSGRRKWGEKYWQGSLFLLSWDQYWSLSQISRCLLKNLCLNYLVRVLSEGKASLTCLKVREQLPCLRGKTVKESKPASSASLYLPPFMTTFLHSSSALRLHSSVSAGGCRTVKVPDASTATSAFFFAPK